MSVAAPSYRFAVLAAVTMLGALTAAPPTGTAGAGWRAMDGGSGGSTEPWTQTPNIDACTG